MLAALQRVGIQIEQRQQPADCGGDPFPHRVRTLLRGGRWGFERLQNRQLQPRVAAGGIDREFDRIAEPLNAILRLIPVGQPLLPEGRPISGELVD